MRKALVISIVIILIAAILGGYFAWSYYVSINQNQNKTTNSLVEQIRDRTLVYIAANYTGTVQLMQNLNWAGGRQGSGLLGSETYRYNSTDWSVQIQYPVISDQIYNISVSYISTNDTVAWTGTYSNGTITETSQAVNITTATLSRQEQVRNTIIMFIGAYHNETTQYMTSFSWTGGDITPEGFVGGRRYSYQSAGWNIAIQYPVGLPPSAVTIYTVNATYSSAGHTIITWQGTLQSGIITQNGYEYNP